MSLNFFMSLERKQKVLQLQQQKPFSSFFENMLHDPLFADAHNAVGKFQIRTPEKLQERKTELVGAIFLFIL